MNNNMERMPMPLSSSPPPPFHRRMMMHMTFYWGNEALILFPKWPGDSSRMYYIALVLVFLLAVFLEWMSHSRRLVKHDMNDSVRRVVQAGMHGVRMGLAYLVMLAVMSFNGGVFVAAVAGHVIGLFVFGRLEKGGGEKSSHDLPPMSC